MHPRFFFVGCVLAAATVLLFYGPRLRRQGATVDDAAFPAELGGEEPFGELNVTEPVPWTFNGTGDGEQDFGDYVEDGHGVEGEGGTFKVEEVVMVGNLSDVQNNTLGFQEVYVINLPERSDKRDAFALQAKLSNISYTLVEGIDGNTVSEKARPYRMDIDTKAVGCWRSHLNILRGMVERDVATALVFEDDADWDVALKKQLVQFARGTRFLTNTPNERNSSSPYGDDWDLLWLGHCSSRNDLSSDDKPLDNRRFVIPDDPTVLTADLRVEYDKPSLLPWKNDDRTRIVYVPTWGSCTAAYAVSLRGAEKILYHQSLSPFNDEIDEGLAQMAMLKTADFKVIAPYPPLVGVSKPAGPMDRWSDLGHIEDWQKGQNIEFGLSERVMFSTRQNIDRLLRHETVFVAKNGWELGLDEIGRAVGHPEWLTEEQMPEKNGPGFLELQNANEAIGEGPPDVANPEIYNPDFLSMITEKGTNAVAATATATTPTPMAVESNLAENTTEAAAIETSAREAITTQSPTSASVASEATETSTGVQQKGANG